MKTFKEMDISDGFLIRRDSSNELCYKVSDTQMFNMSTKEISAFADDEIITTDIVHKFTLVTIPSGRTFDPRTGTMHDRELPMLWSYPLVHVSFRFMKPGTFFTIINPSIPFANCMSMKIDNWLFIDFINQEIGYVKPDEDDDNYYEIPQIYSENHIIREEYFQAYGYAADITSYINGSPHPLVNKYLTPEQVVYVCDLVHKLCTENIIPGNDEIAGEAYSQFESELGGNRMVYLSTADKAIADLFKKIRPVSKIDPAKYYSAIPKEEKDKMYDNAVKSAKLINITINDGTSYDFAENIINKLSE